MTTSACVYSLARGEQSRAEQSKAKQSKATQIKSKQNETKQNRDSSRGEWDGGVTRFLSLGWVVVVIDLTCVYVREPLSAAVTSKPPLSLTGKRAKAWRSPRRQRLYPSTRKLSRSGGSGGAGVGVNSTGVRVCVYVNVQILVRQLKTRASRGEKHRYALSLVSFSIDCIQIPPSPLWLLWQSCTKAFGRHHHHHHHPHHRRRFPFRRGGSASP